MTRRVSYPFHRIILLYSQSPYIYVLYLHISPGMINDAHDNVIRMIFFNEPKIEYYNNSYGTYTYIYNMGIIVPIVDAV